MAETPPSLAGRVDRIEKTPIRTMYDLAEGQDGDLVRFEIGEPDFDTPEHIVDAAADAARGGGTHYTSNAGIAPLREAIATKSRRDHDLAIDADDVVATAGASEAILLSLFAVAEAGDEVVLPTPAWPQYRMQIRLVGATPVEVALSPDTGFALDVDAVADAIDEETACVILCSPSNPTSQTYDRDAVANLIDTAAEHGTYVLLDEVYASLDFEGDGRSLADLDAGNVIHVNACSKQYAMTGWRLGWLAGPPAVVDATRRFHPGTTTCASSVSQHAGIAALTGPQDAEERMYEAFRERRDYVRDRVADIPDLSCPTPEGGFYAFVDVRALDGSSVEIAERLLAEYGVVTVPGTGFGAGGEGHLRVSFATGHDRLRAGFDRIERMVRDERE